MVKWATMDEQQAKAKLTDVAQRLKVEQYRKPCLTNEQATRKWLIEPALVALGWDVHSTDVHPEDEGGISSKADYGLRVNGKVRVFVEAKALGKALDDKDAEQTSNYANNKGVDWCVLTNGRIWRVYKSSGAALSKRLLFEVEVEEDAGKINDVWQQLRYLSRSNVQSEELDKFANGVFIDNRLRDALQQLLQEPTQKFINILKEALKGFSTDQIKEALKHLALPEIIHNKASVSGSQTGTIPSAGASDSTSTKVVGKAKYGEATHLQGKPQHIIHLFHELQRVILEATSEPSQVVYTKLYIGYKLKKLVADVQVNRNKLKLSLALNPKELDPLPSNARDVTNIGHWGNGDLEFSILSKEDLDQALPFIKLAFEKSPK
jgi:predicted type IV restriction endonuclease/predicted transport protein